MIRKNRNTAPENSKSPSKTLPFESLYLLTYRIEDRINTRKRIVRIEKRIAME